MTQPIIGNSIPSCLLAPNTFTENQNQATGLRGKVVMVYSHIQNFFLSIYHQVKFGLSRVWRVVWNNGCGIAIFSIGVFASAFDWYRPGTKAKINLWGARVSAMIIEYRAELAKEVLVGEIRSLERQNQQLNQELNNQLIKTQVTKNNECLLILQNEHLNRALQVAQKNAIHSLEGQAELERERNQFAAAKRALIAEVEQLKNEKDLLTKQNDSWKAKYEEIFPVVEGNARELTEAYRNFQAILNQAHQAYQRGVCAPNLNILLVQANNRYRATYETMLVQRIAALPANDPVLVSLRGLLECSQRDREISTNVNEEFAVQATLFNLANQLTLVRGK